MFFNYCSLSSLLTDVMIHSIKSKGDRCDISLTIYHMQMNVTRIPSSLSVYGVVVRVAQLASMAAGDRFPNAC